MLALCALLCSAVAVNAQVGGLGKSSYSTNRIIRYAADVSTDLSPAQQDLQEATMKISRGGMIGAPEVVRLNMNLMLAIGAEKALDVGFFTGFSALGAALAMGPNGKVVGMDVTTSFYDQVNGSQYWQYPDENVLSKLDAVLTTPAKDTMERLIQGGESGTFDFCFIDADKGGYPVYYEQCLTLLRSGGIMTIDNALWGGSVAWPGRQGSLVKLLDDLNRKIGKDSRVNASLLPIADGLWVVVKK